MNDEWSPARTKRLQQLIGDLYRIVDELELEFERKFTPDGHLVGSLGEVIVAYSFGLTLHTASSNRHDATDPVSGTQVQIKMTGGTSGVTVSSCPDHLIAIQLTRRAPIRLLYNGPGQPVWEACGKMQKNGQRPIGIARLMNLSAAVNAEERLAIVRPFFRIATTARRKRCDGTLSEGIPEAAYRSCVDALDQVTGSSINLRRGMQFPYRYEADMAAMRLMQATLLHVNAVSSVAMIPYLGSHVLPAWVLLRSAFESSLIANWLAEPNDWIERETRWLRWIPKEEDYVKKLAVEFKSVNFSFHDRLAMEHRESTERRSARIDLLIEEAKMSGGEQAESMVRQRICSSVSMPQILKELDLPPRTYIFYRIASHIVHAGPSASESEFRREGGSLKSDACT